MLQFCRPIHSILAISLIWLNIASPTFGKSKTAPLQGLVEEQPTFDLSSTKLMFQLGAQHNELRKAARRPLLHAQDSMGLLKGDTKKFRLSASANGANLQSQTAKNGKMLQGKIDANGKPLMGKVIVDPRSPLSTVERFSTPFQLALNRIPDLAPDISFRMDEQIERAHRQTEADLDRREKLMDSDLAGRAPKADMPNVPDDTSLSASLSKAMDSEIKKAQDFFSRKFGNSESTPKLAAIPGSGAPPKGPGEPERGSGNLPKVKMPEFPGDDNNKDSEKRLERAMDSQLSNSRTTHVEFPNSNSAKAPNIHNEIRLNDNRPSPGLDAILTHARSLPVAQFPTLPKSNDPTDMTDVVPWDEWHAHFAQLARGPILKNVSSTKNPSGSNTVEITVWKDLRVDAKLTKSSTPEFDQAILKAYKSLSGSPGLTFPAHSRRDKITFQIDNEHHGAGIPSSVESQTKTGDKEIIQYHI